MNTYGTCHFTATRCAVRYYATYGYDAADVHAKIEDGEIFIGRPEGECTIDADGRYWVREQVAA